MKTLLKICGVVLALGTSTLTYADCSQKFATDLEDQFLAAINADNADQVVKVLGNNIHFYGAYGKDQLTTSEQLHHYYVNLFKGKPNLKAKFMRREYEAFGNNSGGVSNNYGFDTWTVDGKKVKSQEFRYTFVYKTASDGTCKLNTYHASPAK